MEERRKIRKLYFKEAHSASLSPVNLSISVAVTFSACLFLSHLPISDAQKNLFKFFLSMATHPALLHSALLYRGMEIKSNCH